MFDIVCLLTLITCALVVFTDWSVPSWLPWAETAVIVGLMLTTVEKWFWPTFRDRI